MKVIKNRMKKKQIEPFICTREVRKTFNYPENVLRLNKTSNMKDRQVTTGHIFGL